MSLDSNKKITKLFIGDAEVLLATGQGGVFAPTETSKLTITTKNNSQGYEYYLPTNTQEVDSKLLFTEDVELTADEQKTARINLGLNIIKRGTGTGSAILNNSPESIASGQYSLAQGESTQATGPASHAEGDQTEATGDSSHAEGKFTKAHGRDAHAEGNSTIAYGWDSHAEGYLTKTGIKNDTEQGKYAHAEGCQTSALGKGSHAEGVLSQALAEAAHSEGESTIANGLYSHSEGVYTKASGQASHAEGGGNSSKQTEAQAIYSHAEGFQTLASGEMASHAEGHMTTSSGKASHAEGLSTFAEAPGAHAEGNNTKAKGSASHAEGYMAQAGGNYSHAEGYNTFTKSLYQHVQGKFNKIDAKKDSSRPDIFINEEGQEVDSPKDAAGGNNYAFIVGNGSDDNNRSNAHTLDWKGNAWFAGDGTFEKNGYFRGNLTVDGSFNVANLTIDNTLTATNTEIEKTISALNLDIGNGAIRTYSIINNSDAPTHIELNKVLLKANAGIDTSSLNLSSADSFYINGHAYNPIEFEITYEDVDGTRTTETIFLLGGT